MTSPYGLAVTFCQLTVSGPIAASGSAYSPLAEAAITVGQECVWNGVVMGGYVLPGTTWPPRVLGGAVGCAGNAEDDEDDEPWVVPAGTTPTPLWHMLHSHLRAGGGTIGLGTPFLPPRAIVDLQHGDNNEQ